MGLAVLGMKSMGSGVLLKSNTAAPEDFLRFALSQPTSVVITGIDSQKVLDQAFRVASSFKPLTTSETSELMKKTAAAAANGGYEAF